jgi:hypothetical protein
MRLSLHGGRRTLGLNHPLRRGIICKMADPLSIAASIVGATVPALHGARLLLDDLQKINDAPETVNRLKDDVRSVDMALTSLQTVKDEEWESLGKTIAEDLKATISTCTRACDEFRNDFKRWTRHSGDGILTWQDRANVGFFKQERIKTMSERKIPTSRIVF